jgi:transposase-like protein
VSWIERADSTRIVIDPSPLTVAYAKPERGGSVRQFSTDEMVRLYAQDRLSVDEVAARMGCTGALVRLRLAQAGVPPRGRHQAMQPAAE